MTRRATSLADAVIKRLNRTALAQFYVVLFTSEVQENACRLMKFIGNTTWSYQMAPTPVKSEPGKHTRFLNAFCISRSQILLITQYKCTVFDDTLKEINETVFKDLDPFMERLLSFSQGIKGYMLVCSLKTFQAEHKECHYTYKDERNVSGSNSWIVRCNFDITTY